MTELKVVSFERKKEPPKEEKVISLPTPEEIEHLLFGKKMTAYLIHVENEDGQMSYLWDGMSIIEMLGTIEMMKASVTSASLNEDDYDSE